MSQAAIGNRAVLTISVSFQTVTVQQWGNTPAAFHHFVQYLLISSSALLFPANIAFWKYSQASFR
jgi:hypothetical protein